MFAQGDLAVVAVTEDLVDAVRARAAAMPLERPVTVKMLRALFAGSAPDFVGPIFQSYAERGDFLPAHSSAVRRLHEADGAALRRLGAACPSTEWRAAGLRSPGGTLFGCFLSGSLVAVAHYVMWTPYAAGVCMITHPAQRGQGFGKAVVSAAMREILASGHLVVFQTHSGNPPSVALAKSLGCKEYGQTFIVVQARERGTTSPSSRRRGRRG